MDRRSQGSSRCQVARAVSRVTAAAVATTFLLTANPTSAESVAPAVLAASCASCHGPGGASPGAIPSIDKLNAATMTAMLNGFRSGQIEATVMNRIAKGYSDAEVAALVQYFAGRNRQ